MEKTDNKDIRMESIKVLELSEDTRLHLMYQYKIEIIDDMKKMGIGFSMSQCGTTYPMYLEIKAAMAKVKLPFPLR